MFQISACWKEKLPENNKSVTLIFGTLEYSPTKYKLHYTLVIAFPQSIMDWKVSSDVSGVRTTSKSFMTGTGLKKWRPPNRSNLFGVAAAMSPIAKDDVFEAKIVLAGATASYNELITCFHEFCTTNLGIFSRNFLCFPFKDCKVSFFKNINSYISIFFRSLISIKKLYLLER